VSERSLRSERTIITARADDVLAQLVERSRCLGDDRTLVVFGGGNTSVKATVADHLGRERRIMWVKGSGSDLVSATPADFPALRLDDLLPLRDIDALDDDEMIALVSRALVDPSSKRPSIETLLHAFLPFTHIDHVHADAICALTNHAEGERTTREALGDGFAYVDWIRPGFRLSKIVSGLAGCEGVVLAQHGLITWAESSADCLVRTQSVVARAQEFVEANRMEASSAPGRCDDVPDDEIERLLLHLRGSLSANGHRVLRVDERLRPVADRPDLADVVAASVSSADHMLRIKPWSTMIPDPLDADDARRAIADYVQRYEDYVERHAPAMPPLGAGGHDPLPNVMLVPGVGGITAAANRAEAAALAEVALHTHTVAAATKDALGTPTAMPESETFAFDYWPMELYKLTLRPAPKRFAGRVFVVTGAASGIGRGVALHLGAMGANLVLADLNGAKLDTVGDEVVAAGSNDPVLAVGDQTDAGVVEAMVSRTVRQFGGLDGIVANAGIGVSGQLHELADEDWARALNVNLTSSFLLTRAALRVFREQGIGGSLVYIASKNAFAPGAGFGAYSVSKAGMVQLMRIAALEGGPHGIRANAVNPDAVFDNSGLWEGGIREERAAAHGIAPDELEDFYASRNLLHRRVTTSDVASAVAYLLSDDSSRTTGTVIPVDGGVAGAFPR